MSTRITELPDADLAKYSVHELYAAGLRFVDDYDETDAVEQYLELHPDAERDVVAKELRAEIGLTFRLSRSSR